MADPELVTAGTVGVFALVVAYASLASGHLTAFFGAFCVVLGAGAVAVSTRIEADSAPLFFRGGIALAVLGAVGYGLVVVV